MSLLNWIYSKKENIEIEFSTDSWPKKSGLKLYDYETIIKYKNTELIGRGVDESEPVAIIKSVSEVIERLICHDFDISSVGLSIQNEDQSFDAEEHAKNETLERFYLKQHIDQNLPFIVVEKSFDLLNQFKKHNSSCSVTFFKMGTPDGYYGGGCLLESKVSSSVGFSFSGNEMQATEKAFVEAIPNYFWLLDNEISNDEKPWHLQSAFISKIKDLCMVNDRLNNDLNLDLILPEIDSLNIDLSKHEFLSTAPITVKIFRIKNEN